MQIQFTDTLTATDAKRHIVHKFQLAEPASHLRIRLWHDEGGYNYATEHLSNMLTLTVFDPHGFRGEGHRGGDEAASGRLHEVVLTPTTATPGYLVGALPAGEWRVVINTHRITDVALCDYILDVESTDATDTPAAQSINETTRTQTQPSMGGWLRGDLHAHTVHSDGHWDVPDVLAHARKFKLDFVTLTDHNTTSALVQMDAANTSELLTMGGLELTTFHGHALALGVRQWVNWHWDEDHAMRDIPQQLQAQNATFIIAHPKSMGDPICTGCDWTYPDMLPGTAKIVEVWNGGPWRSDSNNEEALRLYYGWLNQGYRLVATSGTDVHGPYPDGVRPGFDVVYASERSEQAILQAIRAGHLYLSSGPHLELTAEAANGQTAMMGDVLAGLVAHITVRWAGCSAGQRLHLVMDGEALVQLPVLGEGSHTQSLRGQTAAWCAAELRADDGELLALTNPIFFRAA